MSQFLTLETLACCVNKLAAKVRKLEGAATVLGQVNQVALVAGNAVVPDPAVNADTTVIFNRSVESGVPGELSYTIEPGVGVTFFSDSIEDASTIAYTIQP